MALSFPKTIKFIITDFDGIVTDNCVWINNNGELTRKLNFKDVMAFSLLKKSGYKIGIISGEKNAAIDLISEKFNIEEVHQGIRNKLEILKSIINKYSLGNDEYIYVGDDVNDYECLVYSKHKATVPDAIEKVLNIKDIQITSKTCGNGAFREIVDALIIN